MRTLFKMINGGSTNLLLVEDLLIRQILCKETVLGEVWEKEIWPPSSPACSPVENFAWGVSELKVKAQLHN